MKPAVCALWLGGIGACASGADAPSGTAIDARPSSGTVDGRTVDGATADGATADGAPLPVDARVPLDAAIGIDGSGSTGPTIGFGTAVSNTESGGGNGGGLSEVDCAAGQIPTGVEIAVGARSKAHSSVDSRQAPAVHRKAAGRIQR